MMYMCKISYIYIYIYIYIYKISSQEKIQIPRSFSSSCHDKKLELISTSFSDFGMRSQQGGRGSLRRYQDQHP